MSLNSIHSPYESNILNALQFQGRSNDCGPYTTATVINALLGLNLAASELADQMDRPGWRGPLFVVRRVPNWATFPWGIVDVFRAHGLKASWRPLASLNYLKPAIAQGQILMPIIGSWKSLWAHVMTLLSWNLDNGWGFANTQYSHHNIGWVSNDTFIKKWRALGNILVQVTPI